MRTLLCDVLGCAYPVMQAPIGGAAGEELAIAVTVAGGVGSLAMTGLEAAEARRKVEAVAAAAKGRPFVANFLLHFDIQAEFEAALEAAPPVVSFFWGDPTPYVDRCHAAGAKVCLTVGSVDEARRAVDAGCDLIVAQGWEAGGHVRGSLSTLALVPAVLDVVDVPVIAAGGISDGRALAAVIALGAAGAWIGTAFLAADEADVHEEYRARVLAADATDTRYGTLYDVGWPDAPGRTLINSTYTAWDAAGRPSPGARPGEGDVVATGGWSGDIVRFTPVTARQHMTGDIEALPLWAGQGVGQVAQQRPARRIVEDLVAMADARLAAVAPGQ